VFICILILLVNTPSTTELVIARYDEDIEWVRQYSNFKITIYNKGPDDIDIDNIKLPNVGVCDHTYLYHIINRYDTLSDVTIFLSGTCMKPSKLEKTKRTINQTGTYFEFVEEPDLYNFKLDSWNMQYHPEKENSLYPCEIRPFGKWFDSEVRKTMHEKIQYHGIFAVSKEDIRKNSIDFYKNLIRYVDKHKTPEASHYMERAWTSIFLN
jgi:hypothetical protein